MPPFCPVPRFPGTLRISDAAGKAGWRSLGGRIFGQLECRKPLPKMKVLSWSRWSRGPFWGRARDDFAETLLADPWAKVRRNRNERKAIFDDFLLFFARSEFRPGSEGFVTFHHPPPKVGCFDLP